MGELDAAHAAVYGALIGFLGGCAAQILSQALMSLRERAARVRQRDRTVRAFGSMIKLLGLTSAYYEKQPDALLKVFDGALTPLRSALERPDLYLSLDVDQIQSVFMIAGLGTIASATIERLNESRTDEANRDGLEQLRLDVMKSHGVLAQAASEAVEAFGWKRT